MKPENRHLVVFAKQPRMGNVKTRLARDIGYVAATHFYRHVLTQVLTPLGRDPRWRSWMFVAPDKAAMERPFWPDGFVSEKQGAGDLGLRMENAFNVLPPGPAVIIGTDIPGIRATHIQKAFRALGNHDAVFGPAPDGGYWLVGLKRSPMAPELFRGVRWSTSHALADTVRNLERAGKTHTRLEVLEDVDDAESYARCSFNRGISSTKLQGR